MKTTATLIISLLFATASLAFDRSEAEQLFAQANTAYEAGEFATALALYDSVATEFSSFELWYNAGNAAFRTGELGRSILNYERARRIKPTDDDLQVNLTIANERVADRIAELPSMGVENLWTVLTASARLPLWSILAILFQLFGFGFLAGWLFAGKPAFKRAFFALGVACIFIGFTAYGMANATMNRIEANTEAVILAASVEVKNGPSSNENNAFVLHEGTKVKIRQQRGEWFEIKLANGRVGWVLAETIETI
ncbi:MAG: SH3 domain-containing protein [Flavobacteriales bacterium]|jgi:tetratricopeptide (TPR) repeat protein